MSHSNVSFFFSCLWRANILTKKTLKESTLPPGGRCMHCLRSLLASQAHLVQTTYMDSKHFCYGHLIYLNRIATGPLVFWECWKQIQNIDWFLPNVDQLKEAVTTMRRTTKLTRPEPPRRTIRHTIMATVRGRIQYPNTQRLWKNDLYRQRVKKSVNNIVSVVCSNINLAVFTKLSKRNQWTNCKFRGLPSICVMWHFWTKHDIEKKKTLF